MSIGVNLNPDKICNFDCIYCQVNRTTASETRFVEIQQLLDELQHMLELVLSDDIYTTECFSAVPEHLRRLNDIAFSGDGEPTTYKNFDDIIGQCAMLKQNISQHYADSNLQQPPDPIKMVLITNASMFHREHVERGLKILDQNQGEIWAKLDAGTDDYYQLIERTAIPFQQVLDNLLTTSRIRPLVIQSLFMQVNGTPPSDHEIQAYCQRLNEITDNGGSLASVQIYTIARQPAESYVTPLADEYVDAIVKQVTTQTGLRVEGFYGYQT
jgi:wyosine [tRNA(Phe)-imidazoG37] synthetase (radical SAM superfamily)|tara:strand:+ start:2450 stop:3259 length:810 start_codon:yes stop_codon:yes gene_type:complete